MRRRSVNMSTRVPAPGRTYDDASRCGHTHIQSRGCLSTQSVSEDERRLPLARTRVYTREEKHANRAGGKETPVGESCEHVTKTNDRAAIGREMWFSFFYIDDNQLGSPFGMIPYGFNAK